jgi:hypothetical protein
MKTYLKHGDRVFATGVYLVLVVDATGQHWVVDGFEDDTYGASGNLVEYDEKSKRFYEIKSDKFSNKDIEGI